jgi:tetratricopeptide (TPR) repeat protein
MGFLGLALEQQGNIDEAIATFEELRGMSGGSASPNLAHALALAGRKHEAEEMLDQLLSQAQQQYVAPFGIAADYTGLGDKGRALEWLQKSFEVRDAALIHVRWDPRFKPLHATPAFEDLVKRIGHRG